MREACFDWTTPIMRRGAVRGSMVVRLWAIIFSGLSKSEVFSQMEEKAKRKSQFQTVCTDGDHPQSTFS